jgi:hypothetical protein
MYDMRVIKVVNSTSNTVAGVPSNGFKYVWFNYKYVSEYTYDVVTAINNNTLHVFDYHDVAIPQNIGAVEVSNLIQEIYKEDCPYMWNINIGKIIICKFRLSAANAGVTADTSPAVFSKLEQVMQYLLIGMLKEAANALELLEPDELLTASVKEFYCMLMRTADAS